MARDGKIAPGEEPRKGEPEKGERTTGRIAIPVPTAVSGDESGPPSEEGGPLELDPEGVSGRSWCRSRIRCCR